MTEFLKRGHPGLVSIKNLPILQDAPPPGGFPSIRIERRLPNTGPTGVAIFGIAAAVMGYGFFQLSQQKDDKKCQADEIFTVRTIVHPILQAEWDLRYLEHKRKEAEKEAEIMKNVPGWVAGEATTKHRWLPPIESWAKRSLI
mmetsp:Transcript_16546/g.28355  ORF Transcript_16546/g.28355 Transcript_16546/m.28355 type:complete len:143 (-) Transcript_16546:664-1092(-)|eukprot:CAMPEP_0119107520 /NCGR_PEP_ID=MMETSP1180-20130426/10706_1 /TAXON_ID=3052 ORGANISM="Chlamydomonas cf sp, Strain CCMP681" /NCGR_SAMPLE_ID=MMETSP1180 /ASSEMBLY_ACC=CAM_ASM_000741 /LENGTH=142 /DNA_ID=CAMNT_0007093023 /DNA_START=54 /DNA_END=482 /DNA_ORIENTATION=+